MLFLRKTSPWSGEKFHFEGEFMLPTPSVQLSRGCALGKIVPIVFKLSSPLWIWCEKGGISSSCLLATPFHNRHPFSTLAPLPPPATRSDNGFIVFHFPEPNISSSLMETLSFKSCELVCERLATASAVEQQKLPGTRSTIRARNLEEILRKFFGVLSGNSDRANRSRDN